MTSPQGPAPADDPDETFEVEVTRNEGGVDLVTARGVLDLTTAVKLRHVLTDPVLCGQPVVVVDLNGVTFLDSSGIGTLVAGRRAIRERGGRFVVVADDGPALRVLRVTRMHTVMQVWPTLDVVLEALRARREPRPGG